MARLEVLAKRARRAARNIQRLLYHQAERPVFYSMPCASPPQYLRRICRILSRIRTFLVSYSNATIASPPMNRVSPVKTTRSLPSSMSQQILSCVWQGVCNAFTEIPCPILKVSSCFGVRVTSSQSLPPMTDRPLNWDSCALSEPRPSSG